MEVAIGLGLLLTAGVAAWRTARGRLRQHHLMRLCHRAGLRFLPAGAEEAPWLPFRWAVSGRWLRAENLVWDPRDPEVRAFDLLVEDAHRPSEPSAGPVGVRRRSCAVAAVAASCPRLLVRSERFADAIARPLLGDEIDLDLEAFNRRFRVWSEDRGFAIAFCDQRMMRAMLALPSRTAVAACEDRILLFGPELSPGGVVSLLEAARALRDAVPGVLGSLFPPRPERSPYEGRWLQGHWSREPIGSGEPDASAPETG